MVAIGTRLELPLGNEGLDKKTMSEQVIWNRLLRIIGHPLLIDELEKLFTFSLKNCPFPRATRTLTRFFFRKIVDRCSQTQRNHLWLFFNRSIVLRKTNQKKWREHLNRSKVSSFLRYISFLRTLSQRLHHRIRWVTLIHVAIFVHYVPRDFPTEIGIILHLSLCLAPTSTLLPSHYSSSLPPSS